MGVSSGPSFILRDLTAEFKRKRSSRRPLKGLIDLPGQRLLDDGEARPGHVTVEMAQLPPMWIEAADEAREHLKAIKEKLVALTKAQQRRLLRVMEDDASHPEVDALSRQIHDLVRKCEQKIHQVKTRGCGVSGRDVELRTNAQRNLATQLQTLSGQFRQMQKGYMGEIQSRQKGAGWEDTMEAGVASRDMDSGFTDIQLQELEGLEVNATQRSREIDQIASSISDLHTIFKELAVLVIDQGSILDRIDYNIEQVVLQSAEANNQLQQAAKSQKSNRAMNCIYCLVLINFLLLLILILRARS